MGITVASLYNAFGDKRPLYERALERYVGHGFRARVHRFETRLPPRDAIVVFFGERDGGKSPAKARCRDVVVRIHLYQIRKSVLPTVTRFDADSAGSAVFHCVKSRVVFR